MKKRKKGFTLIELLAIILLLGLVVGISTTIYLNINSDKGTELKTISNKLLFSTSKSYVLEKPVNWSYDNNEYYYCVGINQLVKSGYFKKKQFSDDDYNNKKIKIIGDFSTKTITKYEVIDDTNTSQCISKNIIIDKTSFKNYTSALTFNFSAAFNYESYTCNYELDDGTRVSTDANGTNCEVTKLFHNTNYKLYVTGQYTKEQEKINNNSSSEMVKTAVLKEPLCNFTCYKSNEESSCSQWHQKKIISCQYSGDDSEIYNKSDLKYTINGITIDGTDMTLDKNGSLKASVSDGKNTVTKTYEVTKLDNVKPLITSINETGNINNQKQISIKYTDNSGSGVNKLYISTNNYYPSNEAEWLKLSDYNVISNEYSTYIYLNKKYYIWVMDKVGNISEKKEIIIKDEPPKAEYSIDTTNCDYKNGSVCWTKGGKNIEIRLSDDIGLSNYKLEDITSGNENKLIIRKNISGKTHTNKILVGNDSKRGYYRKFKLTVTDSNQNVTIREFYIYYIDNAGPVIDNYNGTITCNSDSWWYNFTYNRWDEESGINYNTESYQFVPSYYSSPTVNDSNWKYITESTNGLDTCTTYNVYILLKDNVGNATIYKGNSFNAGNYCGFWCDDEYEPPTSSGGYNDCRRVYTMKYNSTLWSETDEYYHAQNSILAGDLSFGVSYIWDEGTWYKGSQELYNWYNNNCSYNFSSSDRYTWNELTNGQRITPTNRGNNQCSGSYYVSGKSSQGTWYCCPIGYGYYGHTCYSNN